MADKVVEAQLRITGRDLTGGVFDFVAARIKAISGAAAGVQGVANKLSSVGKGLAVVGRASTMMATVPAAIAASRGYQTVLAFEKELNKAQALGELSEKQRKVVEDDSRRIGKETQFTAAQAVEMMRTYIQAGRTVDQARGMTKPTLDFALFGDVDPKKAADTITSIASAYRVGMKTIEEAASASARIGDIVAKSANISRANVDDLSQGFKYAAPIAFKMGMSMEQLGAAIAAMTQNGLRGDEAGVALRSMLVRLVKPTIDLKQAMAELGMSFDDFSTKVKNIDLADFMSGMKAAGATDIDKIKDRLKKIVDAGGGADKQGDVLRDAIIDGLGIDKIVDRRKIAKAVSRYVSGLTEEVDVDKLLKTLEEKNATAGQIARIFDQKQGARLSTLIGGQYEEFLEILKTEAEGASARGARIMEQGLYGAHQRFLSAMENLTLSIAKAGALDAVTNMLEFLTRGINALADTNPKIIEFTTYAVAAAAALGPLAYALSKLSASAAYMLTIPGVASAAGAAAGGGGAFGGAAAGAGAGLAASRLGILSRFGIYGAAGYTGYKLGEGISAVGKVAAGEFWNPKDLEQVAEMERRLGEIEARVAEIRAKSKLPEMADTLASPLENEAQDLRNRIGAAAKLRTLSSIDADGVQGERERGVDQSRNRVEAVVKPDQITAKVPEPVDVTGKVEIEGKADVNVTVKIVGDGRVIGMGAASSGHIKANVGTSMQGSGE